MTHKLWIAAALALAGPGAVAAVDAPAPLPAWIAGDWVETEGDSWSEELWMAPRGGIMLGIGRSGKGDTLTSWEVGRIERGADGKLVFWGAPRGATPVAFTASAESAASATFDNPAHDYPQRIRYWREGDTLHAEISRIDGTNATRWNFVKAK